MSCALPLRVKRRYPANDAIAWYVALGVLLAQMAIAFLLWRLGPVIAVGWR
jgi:hypothetical protein